MLKVGLVGVGGISGAHIPAWDNFDDANLVALCDMRVEQLEKYKDSGKNLYTDFDEMLKNEDLDIVDVCLPTFLHTEYSIKAMEKGINVVCEKPISLESEDVDKIYKAAEKNNVKFMVAHVLRFWPEYELVKELIDTKKYGKLLSGNMQRLSSRPDWSFDNWMTDEKRSGLVPFDLHIHDLDFLVYALGAPDKVHSFRSKLPNQDIIKVLYDFGGAGITAEASWYAAKIPFDASFRFQFEDAVIINRDGRTNIYLKDGKNIAVGGDSSEKTDTLDLPKTNAYQNELRYFADCVINGKNADKIKPNELQTVIETLKSL